MTEVKKLKQIKTIPDLLYIYENRNHEYYKDLHFENPDYDRKNDDYRLNFTNFDKIKNIIEGINNLVGMESCKDIILGFVLSCLRGTKEKSYNFILTAMSRNMKLVNEMVNLYYGLGLTSNCNYFILNTVNINHLLKIKDHTELTHQIYKMIDNISFIIIDIEYIDYADRQIERILNIVNNITIKGNDPITILIGPNIHCMSYFKLDYRLCETYLYRLEYEFSEDDLFKIYKQNLKKRNISIPKNCKVYITNLFRNYKDSIFDDVSEIKYIAWLTQLEHSKILKKVDLSRETVRKAFELFEKKDEKDTGMHM